MSDDIATDDMIRVGDNNVSFTNFETFYYMICDIVLKHINEKLKHKFSQM